MSASPSFLDIESSIPSDITLPAYRASRATNRTRTHYMRLPFLFSALIAALILLCGQYATAAPIPALTITSAHAATMCAEDAPCWTWSTMGNRKRGVVTMHGTPLTVGPCRFARLVRTHVVRFNVRVDGHTYRVNDRMRGDALAMKAIC